MAFMTHADGVPRRPTTQVDRLQPWMSRAIGANFVEVIDAERHDASTFGLDRVPGYGTHSPEYSRPHHDGTYQAEMSFNPTSVAALPFAGFRSPQRTSPAASIVCIRGSTVTMPVPAKRHEGRVVGLIGVVIVLFIVAFTYLMLREIDASSLARSQQRAKQVATKLLADFIIIGPAGRVVSAMTHGEALARHDLSDRAYFRSHLDSVVEARIDRPIHSRLTGAELLPVSRAVRRSNGDLIGVLVAMIDIQALDQIWKDIGLKPDDTTELMGEDGDKWLIWPHGALANDAQGVRSWSRRVAGWPMRGAAKRDQAAIDRETLTADARSSAPVQ
jgi:hypothetical protein